MCIEWLRRAPLRLAVLLMACAAPAFAAEEANVQLAAARASMSGTWTGALGYRDYRSDRLTELPVSTLIEAIPDGATQVRRSRFEEGTGRPPVWITSVSAVDPSSGELVTATFRAGRPAELTTETVEVVRFTGPMEWTLVSRRTGTDGDDPAEIRITESRDGTEWTAVKDVRPVGAADGDWRFRNRTVLRLEP